MQKAPGSPIGRRKSLLKRPDRPYYVARILQNGQLEYFDKEKQFIIPVDSEVRFQLDYGTPISLEAKLLVNKPIRQFDGQVEYTISHPMNDEGDFELEFAKKEHMEGSELDTDHLEVIDPHPDASQFMHEFRVYFGESGSFFVQIAYEDQLGTEIEKYTKPIWINVEPVMEVPTRSIRCKELSLMTVMSRCLGKMDRWPQVIDNVKELGYNAVHFTPFQKYGHSKSHYSLADQTTVDDYFFSNPKALSKEQRLEELDRTFSDFRSQGVLSIVDIVLNHTAIDSKWVVDHPEATYNTDNCPHLWSAWVLDKALADFSNDFANRKIPECRSAPYISNATDLAQVMSAIQKRVIDPIRMHEFFLGDVQKIMREEFSPNIHDIDQEDLDKYKKLFENRGWFLKDHYELIRDELTTGHGSGPTRFNIHLKNPEASYFFMLANNRNRYNATKEVERLLTRLNEDWSKRIGEYMREAYGALEGNIRYFKTEQKKSLIEAKNPIVEPYFTMLPNAQQSKVAHNGWVMNHNCMEDFGLKGWHYLRRTINIWADNIKLRYGKCPADSPYLWKHMTKYVQDMAAVADGFRLDNTHSTPIHVCLYLLQAARCKNRNLFVMAELFTSSAELDAMFCQRLNLNGLVRELQNRFDTGSLGAYFHHLTCQEAVVGKIDETFRDINGFYYKVLHPKKPEDILYDCTHDNPSVVEKFQTGRIALPHIGLSSLGDTSIATTWGYDRLVHEQINCVTEKRLYPVEDQRSIMSHQFVKSEEVKPPLIQPKMNGSALPPAGPSTFDYEFKLVYDLAHKVCVAGEFTGWKPSISLRKEGNAWKGKTTLPFGGKPQLQFKFVINDKDWICSSQLPKAKDGSGSNENNVINVPPAPAGSTPAQTFEFQGGSSGAPKTIHQDQSFEDIRFARRILNAVHDEVTQHNAEIFMHEQESDVLVVTRQFEIDKFSDFDSYVSISRFCFYNKGGDYKYSTSIELPGFMTDVVFAGYLEIPDTVYNDPRLGDKEFIYGPRGCKLQTFASLEGKFCTREKISEFNEKLNFHMMPPSFTCVIKVKSRSFVKGAVQKLNGLSRDPRLNELFKDVPTAGINHALYRCDNEEGDISDFTRGPYGLKNYGQFAYSGIASYMHLLKKYKLSVDMGAELFDNLRAGDWFIDFTANRIAEYSAKEPTIGLQKLATFYQEYFAAVKQLPSHLKPKYVSRIIEAVFNTAVREIMCVRMLDDFFSDSDDSFVQRLSLSIYQMMGRIPSVFFKGHKDTMCAGLRHFSTGYMRCWGRDTFIALRGLLIVTGLEEEARDVILFFARVYRHGLIPNLHDGGNNTRFNARDAAWFFLQAIKDYCNISEEGTAFLQQKFELHFKDDDQSKHMYAQRGRTMTILELILEIVQRHCQGIEFREWNAGDKIDQCMKTGGFDIKITCDLEGTGFCFGGNKDNCGTWMDKMGSSFVTKNRGIPATPRDGAPIELVAMQFSVLIWLSQLNREGVIPQSSISINRNGRNIEVRFDEWAQRMKDNFERCFWIPENPSEDKHHDIYQKMVNRRGIYKDVYRSKDVYTDYQLRCNIGIAMSYAPELFNREHAQVCLAKMGDILMEKGCMGIKTLDPKDRNYNGDYINSDETDGWNYHQGPEWVWPAGFFLKAQLIFCDFSSKEEAQLKTMQWLLPHKEHILKNRWMGLPELTNSHGSVCPDSCVTQAWSSSTIIDAMRDLYYYGREE